MRTSARIRIDDAKGIDGRSRAEHATWREIVRRTLQLLDELSDVIHPDYLRGWSELALPHDHIPTIAEVNERLSSVGWRTLGVGGYVPVYEYVTLLANRVFPVARFLRGPEHVAYSPMPDMAHDLIGHLPMLFSPEHREYLRALARAMARADASVLDHELYEANRDMALLHCDPASSPADIARAEARALAASNRVSRAPSELTHLGRIYLWTIEFGLFGAGDRRTIYGSALLSSPRECRSVIERPEAIVPYSLEAIEHDISFCALQGRYHVASGHAQLREVLSQYEARMGPA